MGMFDYVTCQYPLPGLADSSAMEFQTKDFDCQMETYKISATGRLLKETYHIEDRSDPNALAGSLKSILGCATRVKDGEVDLNFHGVLNFYDGWKDEWVEFNAKFTDGVVVSIERVFV